MFVQMNYENLYFFVFSTDYFDCRIIWILLDTLSSSINYRRRPFFNFTKNTISRKQVSKCQLTSFQRKYPVVVGNETVFFTDTIDKYCRTVIRFTLRANFVVSSPRFLRVKHECDV